MVTSDGKNFETLLGKSVKDFGFSRSSNHSFPLADRVQFLKDQGGRAIIWECKEVRKDYFQLTDLTRNERNTMAQAVASGALAVILFQYFRKSNLWECFGVWWQEWKALEAGLGFVEDQPHGVRRKPGTARVPMSDGQRPACLRPIPTLPSGLLDLNYWVSL